jgi:transposase
MISGFSVIEVALEGVQKVARFGIPWRVVSMSRHAYPSDVTDPEYELIAPLLPAPKPGGRPTQYPRREILNGIRYSLRTGCAWRLLPHDLPPWRITYHYYRLWRLDGTWKRIHDQLHGDLREAEGRNRQPSAAALDSQSVKTTEKGGPMATTRARRSTVASAIFSSTRSAC